MSDLLLYPDEVTYEADHYEGLGEAMKPGARHVLVGNVMIDSLRWALAKLDAAQPPHDRIGHDISGSGEDYSVLTCHRPANVDTSKDFERVRAAVAESPYPVVWPAHHRAAAHELEGVTRIHPLGYLDMIALLRDSSLVITDSGGVYEEALMLGKKIVSLRNPKKNERAHLTSVPEIWRSDAAPRIVDALLA